MSEAIERLRHRRRSKTIVASAAFLLPPSRVLWWGWGMGLKTQKNDAGVDKFLAGITDEQKRTDCLSVLELMKELTGEPAVMWGKAIVGFGSFH